MTKEQFIAEVLILLINKVAVRFRELNAQDYGISRATAYRALKALEEAGLIDIDRGLMLTQTARERLCEPCNYRKKYLKEAQERHRETTRRLHSQI